MGAFADLDAYKAAVRNPRFRLPVVKNFINQGNIGFWISQWTSTPFAGAVPSAAAACNRDTAGALPGLASQTETLYLVQSTIAGNQAANPPTPGILVDRLSHQGGLSGTVTTEQTTNLPTAALTRYTDGEGVQACLEIYSALGTTATTVTIRYTNQAGTANRTSQAVAIGSSSANAVGDVFTMPLQDGDTGVRSVEGVDLLASTGTAGNFGVTLFRPVAFLPHAYPGMGGFRRSQIIGGCNHLPEIDDDACLMFLLAKPSNIFGATPVAGELRLGAA